MKKIKSYTSIWSVEEVIYEINDLSLTVPITFTQMTWFVDPLFFVMMFANVLSLSFIDGAFLKYVGIPIGFTWFMCKKALKSFGKRIMPT
jgi:hypothetical protein